MRRTYWSLPLFLCLGLSIWLGSKPLDQVSYRFPFDQHFALSGTFGELRTNHFHAGLDIKTGGQIGIPVHAIADGYLYRARVGPYGYGRAVYLRHRDGRFSVYAHLHRFNDTIESIIYEAQRADEVFPLNVYLDTQRLVINQGDIIGYSGTSGSSFGPHLHFEIREPDERIIDPLPYFTELIPDKRPPFVNEISFDPIDEDSRVKGTFEKLILPTRGRPGAYVVSGIIPIKGRVGLEYKGYDRLDASSNYCGINFAKLYLDDQLIYNYNLEQFSFEETRSINLHIDYGRFLEKKQRSQRAFIEYGNPFNAYTYANGRGFLELFDNQTHAYRLELADAHGNITTVSGQVRRDTTEASFPRIYPTTQAKSMTYEVKRDVLIIRLQNPDSADARGIFYETELRDRHRLPPSYGQRGELIYLLKLDRFQYPQVVYDSIRQQVIALPFQEKVFPDRNQVVSVPGFRAFFPYDGLFHPLHLMMSVDSSSTTTNGPIVRVGDRHIPVKNTYIVSFDLPDSAYEDLVVAHWNGKDWRYVGNRRGPEQTMYAYTNVLGDFTLLVDSVPPSLSPINFRHNGSISRSQSRLSMRVKDDFSGIEAESIHATLDSSWVLFEYRFQNRMIWHDLRQPLERGEHTLDIKAQDNAGNRMRKKIIFRVY